MSEPVPMAPSVGRFEVRGWLGRGAMADVYLAFDPEIGEQVALKVIRKELADPDLLDAERRGAELQKRVNALAPQVAAVHEYGDLDGSFYVSMEFVDGTDLLEVLKAHESRSIGFERTLDLGHQLCEILEVLHGFETELDGKRIHGIVHGDVKPENLRLQEGDRLRMLDFGVAKHLSLTRKATRNLFGSYPYTPPERLRTGLVDSRSDLWAAGIILYLMASGRRPYPGRSPEELERQIRSAPPLPLPPSCPVSLRAVIERSLALDAADRHATALALRSDLEALRQGRAPTPAPTPTIPGDPPPTATTDSAPIEAATDRGPALDLESTRSTFDRLPAADVSVAPSTGDLATRDHSPAILVAPDDSGDRAAPIEATRRTRPPPPPRFEVDSEPSAVAGPVVPGQPGPAGLLARISSRWQTLGRRQRWLTWLAVVFLVAQVYSQSKADEVVRMIASDAAPNIDAGLRKYRFAAALRPFDIGLGGARRSLRQALVQDSERVIAAFRGDTPTAVYRDWERARDHLAAAIRLHSDPALSARLFYCQAQIDRIDAGSLEGEGRSAEAQRKRDDAIFGFTQAAESDAEWYDPYLGLARIYAYEQLDLAELQAALRQALALGYSWGDREQAQLADAHSSLGSRALGEATALRGQRAERDRLIDAQRHLEIAAATYARILSFGNARKNREAVLRNLDEITTRLREIRRF